MRRDFTDGKDRLRSAALVALIHVALGWALVSSLGYKVVPRPDEALKLFNLSGVQPPPPIVPPLPEQVKSRTRKPKHPEGAAAPPALRNTPTEVAAPKPRIMLPPPPPIAVAPVPGQGSASAAGAAPTPGPGTGRGGTGNGLGSGLSGNGNGGGGAGGLAIDPRFVSGSIDDSDYPSAAIVARAQGTVYFRFLVGPTGRLAGCQVTRSSGNPALDDTTCRLAMRRFRYRPALDTTGRPVTAEVRGEQSWELGPTQELPARDEPH